MFVVNDRNLAYCLLIIEHIHWKRAGLPSFESHSQSFNSLQERILAENETFFIAQVEAWRSLKSASIDFAEKDCERFQIEIEGVYQAWLSLQNQNYHKETGFFLKELKSDFHYFLAKLARKCYERKYFSQAKNFFCLLAHLEADNIHHWLGLALSQQALAEDSTLTYFLALTVETDNPYPYLHLAEIFLEEEKAYSKLFARLALDFIEEDAKFFGLKYFAKGLLQVIENK